MKLYSVKKYQPDFKTIWDEFVTNSKNATFLFYRDFIEYHHDRFEDYSLLVFKENTLVAVLPANRVNTSILSHQGLTYGGLVLSATIKLPEVIICFKHILEFLDVQNVTELQLKSLPNIYHNSASDEQDYMLFKTEAKLVRCDILSVVNPKDSVLSKSRLEGVKRGRDNNLEIREVSHLDTFWNEILIPNLKEKYNTKPVHSLSEIESLKQKFPDNIRQFNVYDNDVIVGGATIFETHNVAHAQYISANNDKNKLGTLDVLHAYLLKDVFKEKPYFDFGSSNENEGQNINEGLLFWKEGFGARSIAHKFYSINTKNYKKLNDIMR